MTEPLDLAPIQARTNAATSGHWYLQPDHGPDFVVSETAGYEHGIGTLDFGEGDQADADREFVLNAHVDVGNLIREVERLRELLDSAEASRDRASEAATQLQAALNEMRRCGIPHPVVDHARCDLTTNHPGWHAAEVGAWPDARFPLRGVDSWPTPASGPAAAR